MKSTLENEGKNSFDENKGDDGGQEGEWRPAENMEDYGGQEGERRSAENDGSQEREIVFEKHISKMIDIRRKALENIKVAQERQNLQYDAKHSQDKANYKVGTLVLVKNSRKLSRRGGKMGHNWLAPYHTHEVLNMSALTGWQWQERPSSSVQHHTTEIVLRARRFR